MTIDPKMIPREVWTTVDFHFFHHRDWPAALAAGLAAWPGAELERRLHAFTTNRTSPPVQVMQNRLILPLPQEASDE